MRVTRATVTWPGQRCACRAVLRQPHSNKYRHTAGYITGERENKVQTTHVPRAQSDPSYVKRSEVQTTHDIHSATAPRRWSMQHRISLLRAERLKRGVNHTSTRRAGRSRLQARVAGSDRRPAGCDRPDDSTTVDHTHMTQKRAREHRGGARTKGPPLTSHVRHLTDTDTP
jgi:hypothetical protein